MIWTWLKSLFVKEEPPQAAAPSARLRRRGPGAPSPLPHRPDPTRNRLAERPDGCLTLAMETPHWRTPDARWAVQTHWRPTHAKRNATKDYRKGYADVWKLDGRMREVSRPYQLRSNMARLGFDDLPEMEGPPLAGAQAYFNGGGHA